MDEVDAVARAINAEIGDGDCSLPASQAFAERIARAAIAALDEYRTSPQRAIDYIARSPHIQEAIRKAKSEPPIEWGDDGVSDFAQGREAGLREAPAVAGKYTGTVHRGWDGNKPAQFDDVSTAVLNATAAAIADMILALIDAKERVSANE